MEWLVIVIIIYIAYHLLSNNSEKLQNKNHTDTTKKYGSTTMKPKLNVRQIDISNISLSAEQKELFDIMEHTNNHIFVTGKAGTGKSVLLQYFRQNSHKHIVVSAPTGVAALNVGGQTIHSLFRIAPDFVKKENLRVSPKTATLLRNVDTVVIDEVSMVRADLMDAVDHILRRARLNDVPFGGVQMIVFGDLYQLPPIVADAELHKYFAENHGGYHFFNAHALRNTEIDIYELQTIFRQKDASFKNILNSIRIGEVDNKVLALLNTRAAKTIPSEGVINLVTTNSLVSEINHAKLSQLQEKMFEYRAVITGDMDQFSFPTDEILYLKKGAQVMLLRNDKEKRWVNGTVGFVESLSENEVKINIDDFVYSVPQETWNKIRYYYNRETHSVEEEVVSSFTQYPLRLAWAITVHKSQGQTYGSVVVDMGEGAFAHGQTYVALSRCKDLEGLFLRREIVNEDIIVDPDVVSFMKKAKVLTLNGK